MSTTTSYSEKTESILKQLEQGIKDVFVSGRYQEYLTTMAKFPHYSFNNVLLIYLQFSNASYVAGFRTWQHEFERYVNKGEKGIRILAPVSVKREIWSEKKDSLGRVIPSPTTGQPVMELKVVQLLSFREISVFDISQTSGKALPKLAVELKSHLDNAKDLEKSIRFVATCPIEFNVMPDGVNGYYDPAAHKIVIRKGMATSQTIKTMVHELVHSRLHSKQNEAAYKDKDRATMEVEAESIAFVVLQHLGIDTSDYSFGYLASWSSDKELKELNASLAKIQKESDTLIKLITEQMS